MDIFFDNAEHPCRPDTVRSLSPINFFWRSRMLSDGRLSSLGWRCWCHTPPHTWPAASVPRGTVSVSVRLLACWSSTQAKDFRFLRSRVSNFPSSLYYRLVDAVEHSRSFLSVRLSDRRKYYDLESSVAMIFMSLSMMDVRNLLNLEPVVYFSTRDTEQSQKHICSLWTPHTAENKQSIYKLLLTSQPAKLNKIKKTCNLWSPSEHRTLQEVNKVFVNCCLPLIPPHCRKSTKYFDVFNRRLHVTCDDIL